MKTIDINTTQNVTINYELAKLTDRILSTILDWILISIAYFITFFVFVGLFNFPEMVYLILIGIPIYLFYHLTMEMIFNGQSVGKMILGIRVIGLDGRELNYMDYITRWVFRFIDINLSMGAIAAIVSNSSNKGQRIGDIVANSTVIKIIPRNNVVLEDILKIDSLNEYTPKYSQVKNLKEQDLIIIKRALDRYYRFKNDTHMRVLSEITKKISKELDINLPTQEIEFLKTVIKDYIVLTR